MPIETDSDANVEDDVKFLDEEDIKPLGEKEEDAKLPKDDSAPPVEDDKPIVEEEEEEDDEKKLEPEVEEKAEIKDLAPHDRPTIAQLKEKFPTIFKEFPSLRDMYFREQEYSRVFPSIADAKEAADNNTAFVNLRDSVLSGDPETLLNSIKEADPKSLEKMSAQILPALFKLDREAHWKAATPLLENAVRAFHNEGIRSKDDNIRNAALLMSEFLFNDADVATGKKTFQTAPAEKSDEQKQFEQERATFQAETHLNFRSGVAEEAAKGLKEMVLERGADKKLKIDPEGTFSQFIRDSIADRIMKEVGNQLDADKSHMDYMNSLWDKAKKSGYKSDLKSSLTSAYLARAKSLIPKIRSKYVSEAMGTDPGANEKKHEQVEKQESRRESNGSGRVPASGSKTYDAKAIDWSKTSDVDLMDDKPTFKKK